MAFLLYGFLGIVSAFVFAALVIKYTDDYMYDNAGLRGLCALCILFWPIFDVLMVLYLIAVCVLAFARRAFERKGDK